MAKRRPYGDSMVKKREEGRYSPVVNGKRMARNVYASTEEECEEKLSQLIREMKQEIAAR